MRVRPVGDWVLLRRNPPEMIGNIHVLSGFADKIAAELGFEVVAVGDKVKLCKPKQYVLIKSTDFVDGPVKDTILVHEEAVVGVLDTSQPEIVAPRKAEAKA